MKNATFKLESYRFTKASLDLTTPYKRLVVSFTPSGVFHSKDARYDLSFSTIINCEESGMEVVNVSCVASFVFEEKLSSADIPQYFYPNSIAILFPYIRAFVSTLSLQANVQPILLPTLNLTELRDELLNNTKVEE